jgi:branched-chain amino acid transport system substrate-binding protein
VHDPKLKREEAMRVSHILQSLLGAFVLAVAGPALAESESQSIRIMVLNDQTSSNSAAAGMGSVTAAKLAAEDFGGTVAGMPIVVLASDHQNKVDIASSTARKAFEVDQVDAIFDLSYSAASLAVQDLARERKKIVVHVGLAVADPVRQGVLTDRRAVALRFLFASARPHQGYLR